MIEEFCAASPNRAANARNDAGLPMFLHRMWRRDNHSWRAGKLARLCTLQWPNFSNRSVKTPAVKPCSVYIIDLLCSVGSKQCQELSGI